MANQKINKEEFDKIVSLARVFVSKQEYASLTRDIEGILAYVSEIQEVAKTDAISAQSGEHILQNVFREDTDSHNSGIYTATLLSSAPNREANYIQVKKIINKDI